MRVLIGFTVILIACIWLSVALPPETQPVQPLPPVALTKVPEAAPEPEPEFRPFICRFNDKLALALSAVIEDDQPKFDIVTADGNKFRVKIQQVTRIKDQR